MTTEAKPDPIERIFKRLAATYGASWDRSLGQTPIMDVMTVWAHELSGFLQHRRAMQSIAWALENLPDRCPNVIEFKSLCRKAPALDVPALPEPAADPARVAAELAKLAPLRAEPVSRHDSKDWAKRIMTRVQHGERVNVTSARMARDALGMEAA